MYENYIHIQTTWHLICVVLFLFGKIEIIQKYRPGPDQDPLVSNLD